MKNADRPATPCKTSENTGAPYYMDVPHNGLTKREHFAAMAMQGVLTNADTMDWIHSNDTTVAEQALIIADALLKELEK